MVGEDNQTSACPQKNPKKLQTTTTPKKIQTTANNLYIVFDTNTWLYDFDDIKEILYDPYLSFRNYENNFKIGLPYVLYDEFDNIKKYYRDTPEKKTARQVDKLIKDLRAEENPRFWTQLATHDYKKEFQHVHIKEGDPKPDNRIVNCIFQLYFDSKDVHFFTHDINLFNKVESNSKIYSIQAHHLSSDPLYKKGRLLQYFQKPIMNLFPSHQYDTHFPGLSREPQRERGR